jgi:hypoxanthine phosphoribosyltransferase
MTIPAYIKEVHEKASCLFTKNEVEAAMDRMAIDIHREFEDQHPVVLCVMIGGLITTAGLLARADFPLELDYIHASRYGEATHAGELIWRQEPTTDLQGRNVLIVDDVLDGGLTLSAIKEYCEQKQAKRISTAVLVDKEHVRDPGGLAKADFTGLTAPDKWLYGYGLDYKEYLRNAPGIFMVADEHVD